MNARVNSGGRLGNVGGRMREGDTYDISKRRPGGQVIQA